MSAAARLREARGLAVWLAASIALHAAVLLLLPEMELREAGRVEVLQVTLMRQQPPRVPQASSPALRERPWKEHDPSASAEKPSRASAPAERTTARASEPASRPVLTVPRLANEAEPALALPASPSARMGADVAVEAGAEKAAPRGESASRADVARNAPPASGTAPEAKTTPPNFNAGYLRNPPPRYPLIARRNGEHGTVTLKVLVTREGLPADISVHSTSGSRALDQAALEAVKGWRFAPAREGALSVEAWVLVPIVFKLEG